MLPRAENVLSLEEAPNSYRNFVQKQLGKHPLGRQRKRPQGVIFQ
jgi:hypothetical protein